jgi:hypothetical protein
MEELIRRQKLTREAVRLQEKRREQRKQQTAPVQRTVCEGE